MANRETLPENLEQDITGLLEHETAYTKIAIAHAAAATRAAKREYGEAIANSGGDWVFDDPASQSAMNNAGMKDLTERQLRALTELGTIPYPDPSSSVVYPGSRVYMLMGKFNDTFDVVTRKIPGMPEDPQIDAIVSMRSPMGAKLIGAVAGQEVEWSIEDGREFKAQILGVDQTSQKTFYKSLGLCAVSPIE